MGENNETREWNRNLDQQILRHGVLDEDLYWRLDEALHYDSATPVNWAEGKLSLFQYRLEAGQKIEVYDPKTKNLQVIENPNDFEAWKSRFLNTTA